MMKKVLIIGGSRGIGRACVIRFAEAGDRVAFVYHSHDEAASEVAFATGAEAIRADISVSEEATAAVEKAVGTLGGLDVLVICAGVAQIKLTTDLTDADWQRMIGTDLSGAFYVIRAAVPYLVRQQSGRVLCVGSMWGKVGASCEAHYAAAKAGLRGLVMSLAKELGPSQITVNLVEPGVIDTEMNAALDAETRASLCEETPLGRMGTPEEVAALLAFLASDAAGFITGQAIGIDGGFAIGS